MHRFRLLLAAALALLLAGSLLSTGGYAWYLRSASYRAACAAYLSECLSLPSDIGGVVPRSLRAREFTDVVVWLPQRRGAAFRCKSALVRYVPDAADPNAYELLLDHGACELSTRTWLREDYRGVVNSGLAAGLSSGGPRSVSFRDMHLAFEREQFQAELADAIGRVDFERDAGRAVAVCRSLNGFETEEPVRLSVVFSQAPGGIRIDRLDLHAPQLPLEIARLGDLTRMDIRTGTFSGRLAYGEEDATRWLSVSGTCAELSLAEFTAPWLPAPWRGRCPEIELQELRFENRVPTRLRFRGALREVAAEDLLGAVGVTGAGGMLNLMVGEAHLTQDGIERFVASGDCQGVSLEAVSQALGMGTITGTLRLSIEDLTIEKNELASLKAVIAVDEAASAQNWIEGELLRELVQRTLSIPLPPILPKRIEYKRLGVRVEVRDEQLFIFGTHGEKQKTILTVLLGGRELGLIQEPEACFDLRPLLNDVRQKAAEQARARLRGAVGPPASSP